ncbi:DUF6517 family protein [Haloarcula salinisoli]|uniref:Uncharacterized protein n=1 Tax=Haloarcula salinisoli TaxID=2487746 RepID=A0A8J8C8E7_9EURY|nr:DUF6517 family protein [Halomicroarcula salinisoli]MBX0286971.1 hypothetical protein [Halomicroarcula salinisoli]MBX0304272.1 hypothetical protein [Halomicroarcula salinisoli]
MDSQRSEYKASATLSRRKLLLAAGVAGAAGLAGCGGLTNRTVTASDVQMGDTMAGLGFEQGETKTFTNKAEQEAFGVSGSVTAESKLTVFANAESEPDPTEEERWTESDSTMAQWSDNTPVRAVRGSDVIDGEGITPAEGDQFDLMPTESTTLLVPDTDGEPDRVISATPMADIDFGDRVTDGEVTFDPPVPYAEGESFAPAGLAFVSEGDQ